MNKTFLAAILILSLISLSACQKLSKEHNEAKNLSISNIDFSTLKDGEYNGTYYGGMYGWRSNSVKVTVESGKVKGIELLHSKELSGEDGKHEEIAQKVISAQSLQIDSVSGATLTTKSHLKSIENALLKATDK